MVGRDAGAGDVRELLGFDLRIALHVGNQRDNLIHTLLDLVAAERARLLLLARDGAAGCDNPHFGQSTRALSGSCASGETRQDRQRNPRSKLQ